MKKSYRYSFFVGDKVRISVDPKDNPSTDALEHNGEIVTIKDLCTYTWAYELEELPGLWMDGCFEKVN